MKVDYKWGIGDRVTVAEITRPAVVDAVMSSKGAVEYRIIYWDDGVRNVVWVYEWELT